MQNLDQIINMNNTDMYLYNFTSILLLARTGKVVNVFGAVLEREVPTSF